MLTPRLVAGAADLKTAEVKLVATLEQKLRLAATTQVPQGDLVYPEGSWLTIVDSSKDIHREGIAIEIARKGTLEAILMKSTDLAKRIAQKKIAGYKGEAIQVDGLSLLTFTMKDKPTAGPSTLDKLQFQLKGTVQVVYTFDHESFRAALAGLPKKEYPRVLGQYPAIDTARISFSPGWMRSFPSKPERIRVEVGVPIH